MMSKYLNQAPQPPMIDLHGLSVQDATGYLDIQLSYLPKKTKEVHINHGFNRGTALQKMVREYKNRRVIRKMLSINPGITIYILQ